MDLTNCFICLCPTNDPLSCPKCNNFGCKKCFESYFKGNNIKKCPLCNQEIKFCELKKHQIISEIQKIMNNDISKEKKVDELSKLIQEKKKIWENQGNFLNNLLERLLKYQEYLKELRKEYELFLLRCKNIIDKYFDENEKKIQELIESFFSFNHKIDKKNKNEYYSDENIKDLINDILSMERKHFNEENNKQTEKFLATTIRTLPKMSDYFITFVNLKKNCPKKYENNDHLVIGDFQILYNFTQDKN